MLRKIFFATALLAPLLAFAEPNWHAQQNANQNASFKRGVPEIDGSNFVLGITLLAGIASLLKRRGKK